MSEQPHDLQQGFAPIAWLRNSPKNGPLKTFLVPVLVSLVCALLVSGSVMVLRPEQRLNEERSRQENILAAAGLLAPGDDVADRFAAVEPKVIDLQEGHFASGVEVEDVLSGEAEARMPIPRDLDIAVIKSRPRYVVGYFLYESGELAMLILPVYGYGLWSTLYGYVALAPDAGTVVGLRFYRHGETPGLGGEIDNPRWLAQWPGKRIYDGSGQAVIEVTKGAGTAPDGDSARFQVDGISGATMTGRGVTNLLRYWFGSDGFGPFLERLRRGELT